MLSRRDDDRQAAAASPRVRAFNFPELRR
jgi:hypothetical protein